MDLSPPYPRAALLHRATFAGSSPIQSRSFHHDNSELVSACWMSRDKPVCVNRGATDADARRTSWKASALPAWAGADHRRRGQALRPMAAGPGRKGLCSSRWAPLAYACFPTTCIVCCAVSADRAGRGLRGLRPDPGRDGNGEGARGRRHPAAERPGWAAVRRLSCGPLRSGWDP
jgi:hypothetical protein